MESTSTVGVARIEKLMGRENFSIWKFAMQALLESEELWGCVESVAADVQNARKMAKAKGYLILAVDKRNYSHIQECTTPKDIWKKLTETFEDGGLTRKVSLLRSLTSTKLNECKNVEEYVYKISNAAHQLKGIGFTVPEEMLGALMLSGLPEEFKPMIMGLENSGTVITGDSIKIKLLQEIKIPDTTQSAPEGAAFLAKNKKAGIKGQNKVRKCFNCGKPGHFAARCRYKSKPQENESSNNTKAFLAMAAGKSIQENYWYMDSCASMHMTKKEDWLKDKEVCDTTIVAANNKSLRGTAKSSISLKTSNGNQIEKISVQEVTYVPGIAANLLSVSKVTDKGYQVIFDKKGFAVVNERTKEVAAKGRR